MSLRPLDLNDLEAVWRLNELAFGYKTDAPPTEATGLYGIDGPDGRLAAIAKIRSYRQVWGGRPVPMGGIAGVVVEPHARGRGLAVELMRGVLQVLRASGQPVSALFPTAVGIYRPTGWEVVGTLDDTRIPTRDLAPARRGEAATVRSAVLEDVEVIAETYAGLGINGMLVRDGPEFPAGAAAVLEHDVVSVAESAAGVLGYASYDRGSGYREGSELRIWECLGRSGPATAALLRSISSWSTVARTSLWRGPTEGLALHLSGPVPPPTQRQPWMLRIVDAPAAIAARGFPACADVDTAFVLDDPDGAGGAWRLRVSAGSGSLECVDPDPALPVLTARGLALLYSGAADPAAVQRAGHLDRPAPGLAAVFAGYPPQILDYF
ncbi:MAG: hypothetical protein NVS3B26_11140 [Mycobacteriales bacterium]